MTEPGFKLVTEPLGASFPTRTTVPTIAVYGCGGCGINLTRLAKHDIKERAIIKLYDTSTANVRSGDDVKVLAQHGHGSGKIRGTHADEIVRELGNMTDDDLEICDINIVVFSMSGGSGSVIGPVLLRDLAGRARASSHLGATRVVAIVVADSMTQTNAENTKKTLKTLENITQQSKIYLPISIFDNARGQKAADFEAVQRIIWLTQMLTNPAAEVDRNDRINWLNGTKTVGVDPGLRILHITVGVDGSDTDDSVEYSSGYTGYFPDSCLNMKVHDTEVIIPGLRPRIAFNGIFTDPNTVPMLGVIGNKQDTFTKLTNTIDEVLKQFSSDIGKKHIATVDIKPDEISDHGLVL